MNYMHPTNCKQVTNVRKSSYLSPGVRYPNLIAGRMDLDPHLYDNDHTEHNQK